MKCCICDKEIKTGDAVLCRSVVRGTSFEFDLSYVSYICHERCYETIGEVDVQNTIDCMCRQLKIIEKNKSSASLIDYESMEDAKELLANVVGSVCPITFTDDETEN